jgi:hypothetical protein
MACKDARFPRFPRFPRFAVRNVPPMCHRGASKPLNEKPNENGVFTAAEGQEWSNSEDGFLAVRTAGRRRGSIQVKMARKLSGRCLKIDHRLGSERKGGVVVGEGIGGSSLACLINWLLQKTVC